MASFLPSIWTPSEVTAVNRGQLLTWVLVGLVLVPVLGFALDSLTINCTVDGYEMKCEGICEDTLGTESSFYHCSACDTVKRLHYNFSNCEMEEQPRGDDPQSDGKSPSLPGFAIVVMGASGSGKSTVGELLSKTVSCPFIDADDFHTEGNKEKMRNGIALTEDDRLPWLEDLRNELGKYTSKGEWVVLACSALRPQYRDILLTADYPSQVQDRQETVTKEFPDGNVQSEINRSTGRIGKVVFAYLEGSAELLACRLAVRHKEGMHFMPPALLQSQLDLLEITEGDHDIITLDASLSPEEIVDSITKKLLKRV